MTITRTAESGNIPEIQRHYRQLDCHHAELIPERASHPKYPMFRPSEFALIEDAVVDEPHRGKGVGTILFRAAIDWARDHALRHVQTTVWHANAGAREFYLDQGFRPMSVRLELDSEEGQ